ncbi:prepilin peptidase [Phaeovulum sp.]|uniref:prepilin peptidase n=1 Tax=Phaeovulum sp. TaxID=2934796 RepID=UPI0039E60174
MLGLTPSQSALVLLLFITPVCAWVVWSDLKTMKIPNRAVYALVGVFFLVGPFVLPLDVWAWRLVHLPIILMLGFVLNATLHFGAGDAKFAAAAAPFFSSNYSHLNLTIVLLAAFLLGAFTAHRLIRAIPAARAMAPDWVSWQRADFPMGLALVGTLWAYLAIITSAG